MEKLVTQIKLMLVVFGEYFSPEEITQLLKIYPTNSWVKGDVIPLQKGLYRKDNKVLHRKETAWEFSTGFIKTLDFEEVSYRFEKEFENKLSALKSYVQENKLEVALNIVAEIVDEEKPSIHFNKRIINVCKELEAEIDIDVYLLSNN